jgi:putative ABC transport system permease protein
VAVIVGLLFSINILTAALQHSTDIENARLGADLVVLPPLFAGAYAYERANSSISAVGPTSEIRYNGSGYSSQPSFLPGSIVRSISALRGVTKTSPQLFAGNLNDSKQQSKSLKMIAFDPATDFTIRPWLESQQNPSINGDEAIAGGGTGLAVGDELRWKGLTLRVVRILEPTNTSLDQSVFFLLDSAYRAAQAAMGTPDQFPFSPGQITGVLIGLQQGISPQDIAQEIRSYLSDFRAVEASALARNVGVETRGIATYGLVVTGVMAIAVIVLISSIFSMTVNERRRQLGLLRSLGAKRWFIFRSILEEVGVVALLGGVIGLGVGQLVVYFSESYLNALYKVTLVPATSGDLLPSIVESLILGVGIGSLASMYPAFVASLMDPYDAIRRGE